MIPGALNTMMMDGSQGPSGLVPPAIVSIGAIVGAAQNTNITVPMPPHQSGDLLVIFAYAGSIISPGWTLTSGVYWKIAASSSEPNASFNGGAYSTNALAFVVRGAYLADPVYGNGVEKYNTTGAVIAQTPPTEGNNHLVCHLGYKGGVDTSAGVPSNASLSGFSVRADTYSSAGSKLSILLLAGVKDVAGAVNNSNFSCTNVSTIYPLVTFSFIIRAA